MKKRKKRSLPVRAFLFSVGGIANIAEEIVFEAIGTIGPGSKVRSYRQSIDDRAKKRRRR